MRKSLLYILLYFLSSIASARSELNISLLLINGTQRAAYYDTLNQFAKENPEINLVIKDYESEYYKSQINAWLTSEKHSDIMYWFSGQRLQQFVDRGLIETIDNTWQQNLWSQEFTRGAESSVSFNGHKYGLPIHYYPWAIYYKKSLFKRLSIETPKDWDSFLLACDGLAQNGIAPIVLGSKFKWTLSAWFDYLNLRINGLEFHLALTQGKISYKDARIVDVFNHWGELVDKGYFIDGHEKLTWRDSIPYLYRNRGGMTLLGNFWTSEIPASMYQDIQMVSFPTITEGLPVYEEAPTDVLIIPKNVQNHQDAKKLLEYMANSSVQVKLNSAFGMIAPNPKVIDSDDHLLNKSYQILNDAAGLAQFFDRDNPEPISTEGMLEFARFVDDPSQLSDVLNNLETLRGKSFN